MYYVYMLWCRDDTLYTGTASDLCRRMRQHRDGGAACARYTRSHPPRELAGVWRTEGRGEALRLEYAVKRLSRQGKLALLHRPETAAEFSNSFFVHGSLLFCARLRVVVNISPP